VRELKIVGIEVVPVLENEELDILLGDAEWKWMGDATILLEDLARQLGVTPLGDFMSYTRDDAAGAYDEEEMEDLEAEAELRDGAFWMGDGALLWSLERNWHTPETGLQTARALIEHLSNHPEFWMPDDAARSLDEGLIDILREFEAVMLDAQARAKRFYLHLCA